MTTMLRELRRGLGLTQREVAKRAGIDIQRVSVAERSLDPGRISLKTGIPLCEALGVDPSDVLNNESLTV